MNFKKYLICGTLGLVVFSCAPRQEINYMKDIENVVLDNSIKNSRSTFQPGDQLIITVTAKDMDVVKPFNQSYSSSTTVTQYSQPNSNSLPQQLPVSGSTYIVDTDGNITFPQIGTVSTKGENVETLRSKLVDLISAYVKNPVVDLKLINFKISVLGEVNKPGQYVIPDGGTTLLGALGLAVQFIPSGSRQQ